MAKRFKQNKIITNIILFLIVAGIIAELFPYFLIVFIPFLLIRWWLSRKN